MNEFPDDEPVACALPRGMRGACADADPSLFFASTRTAVAEAIRVCRERCTVQATCLVRALDSGQRLGVWGGYTEDERRLMTQVLTQRAVEVAAARAREQSLRAALQGNRPPSHLPRHLASER